MKLKILLQYAILGIIQGLAEIIPISSSGHLFLFQKILKIEEFNLSLEVFLHIASLLALLIFYRKKIFRIIKGICVYPFKKADKDKRSFLLGIYIIIGSLPATIVGILFKDKIEEKLLNSFSIGISLIITGMLILISKKFKNRDKKLNCSNSLSIGLFQTIGMIPGISRSGITLFGSKMNKVNDQEGVDFVFLLLIPICLGAFIFSLEDLTLFLNELYLIPIIISFILAFIFTFVGLKLFYKLIHQEKIKYFAVYCFIVGCLSVLL